MLLLPLLCSDSIQSVGAKASERPLAGHDRAGPGGVLGEDLRGQEDLVASPGDRLAHDLLGVAVHLRGVDVGQAQVEAPTQGVDRVGAIAAVDIPGPLADRRDLATGGAEVALFHDISSSLRPQSSGNLKMRSVGADPRSPTWAGRRRSDRPPALPRTPAGPGCCGR